MTLKANLKNVCLIGVIILVNVHVHALFSYNISKNIYISVFRGYKRQHSGLYVHVYAYYHIATMFEIAAKISVWRKATDFWLRKSF